MNRTRCPARRRGGIYIAVLGTAMVVSLIGLASVATLRSQRSTVTLTSDAAKARCFAQSAAQIGMQLIASDANWRQNHTSGAWVTNQTIDDGRLSLSVTDPLDGNLANRPTDSVIIQGTGMRGNATQMIQATMVATGTPIDALAMAIHTGGELHITGGNTLTLTGAPASTNGSLRDDGTVAGDAQCLTATKPANVTGTLTLLAPSKAMPDSGVESMYVSLGTVISPGNAIDRVALGPGANPYGGGTNADGVYVVNSSGSFTISRCRILGTLVIVCPGNTVTISNNVLIQPARPDYPALIVDGNLSLTYDSTTSLSEATEGTNFNPAGVPYSGVTDSDTADTYPSEIDGLTHVKGTLSINGTCTLRGAVICESGASSNAVSIGKNTQVIYDPTLYSSPPMGYTKSVSMAVQPGSWRQVVGP